MSLMSITQESITQLALGLPAATPPGGGAGQGLLDWLTSKLTELQSTFRLLSVVGGMGFVIWQAIASRGAMARIIVSGLAAALFVWIVWNITSLQDRVDNEVKPRRVRPRPGCWPRRQQPAQPVDLPLGTGPVTARKHPWRLQ